MPYALLFGRLVVRPLRAEPVRTLLTVLAVALGVAVVLAIEMAGEAAAGSFRSSLETLTGDADFEVTASGGVPPEALAALARLPHPLSLRPRIEDYAVLVDARRTVPVIGVDVFADDAAADLDTGEPVSAGRDQVWVGRGLGLKKGDKLRLIVNDRAGEYVVGGVVPGDSGDLVAADLATATAMLRRAGTLDRILIDVPEHRTIEEWEQVLRPAVPAGLTLARFGTRTEENRRMLAAFRWNLRVLSYIALIVGAFLIYNTISVSVVRRRSEIGIVRALGATRGAVLGAFLGEAACFGLAGGLLGLALGRALAEGAVKAVAVTVESLYVSSTPGAIELSWTTALLGLGIGVGISVLSALAPAVEAAQVTPVEAMSRGRVEHEVRTAHTRNIALAGALAVSAFIASRQGPVGGKPMFGYVAAVLMIGAAAFAIPPLVASLAAVSAGAMRRVFGVEALLATRSLAGSLRRTSVLTGALATAIAMTGAVGIMVGSFRQTVLLWMDDRLQADLYLRPAGPASVSRHPTLAADTADLLRALPQVAAIDAFRAYEISYNGRPATLGGGSSDVAARHGSRSFMSGADPVPVYEKLRTEIDTALVSEPFANKHGVRAGDTLQLSLGGRAARLRVLDVYYDYASERGYIIVDRATLLKYLPDPAPSNMAVYLRTGVSLEDGKRAVQAALSGRRVIVLSNRTLREEAIRTFDRTFAITYALEAVAVVVAIMGIAGALLALVIDRRREFGLLRFLGGATSQIRRLILFEAGLLGLLANIAGAVLGVCLSLLLIYVINKQSFGWTIQFHWPVGVLLGALTLIYAATVIAALYPARVAMRLNPIEVVHEE